MNTMRHTTSATNSTSARFHRRIGPALLPLLAVLALGLTAPARAETTPAAIPFSGIGARATATYQGDALGITATPDGALLRCGFQKLEGHATPEGLWLESTKPGAAGKLRLVATTLSRPSTLNSQPSTVLPTTGTVSVADKLVRFTRPGLTEEYSVSVDGVRQDFVIESPPLNPQPSTLNHSAGDLRVELALSGARAEATASGARLTLEGSGRTLAYSRLRVEDATSRELTARLEVLSADRLAVSVADANAIYPVRIDPAFSDADWVSLNPGIPGPNGMVNSVVVDGSGNVYVAGCFTFVGTVPANNIAKWDGHAWSALGSGISGPPPGQPFSFVNALAVSGTNLYAGGEFTTAGGVSANCIAKWDGSIWSSLGEGISGYYLYYPPNPPDYLPGLVSALAMIGTNLYAGGKFHTAGGIYATNIAKWDGSAWSALSSGMSDWGQVNALAVSGTDLYAGGGFSAAGGVSANCIAKWDGSAWSPLGSGLSGGAGVSALAVSGTDLYAGGYFSTTGGAPASGVAKWDGSAWSVLGSGMDDNIFALAVSGTDLYAGGLFATAGGVTVNSIARWNGSSWSALGSRVVADVVNALAVSGTNLYVGGGSANPIAKWDGSAWSALGSGMNGAVEALAVSGTNLYAGGLFTTAGEVTANCIAKWDGSAWSALGSGMAGYAPSVYALVMSGTDLYAGGNFSTAGGVPANSIARWNGSAWSALGSGIAGEGYPQVQTLAVSGTNLYAGGWLTNAGGVPADHIAKWNGTAWSALGSGMNGAVFALAVSGANLYAAGQFTTAGGIPANNIAKWDGTAWSALGSALDLNGPLEALAVSGTDLYAGGYIRAVGGVQTYGIAKWDGRAWSALGSGLGEPVLALAVSGTDLYAGGYWGQNIAKWDGSAWSGLGSGVNSTVIALAADGAGHLFVGGGFSLAGTNVSFYIAQANVGSAPTILRPALTQTAEAGATVHLAVNAAGEPAPAYQWYFNGTNLLSCTSSNLVLTNIQFSQSGTYTVVALNDSGAMTSAPVMLNVIPGVERRPAAGLQLVGEAGSLLNVDYADSLSPAPNWTTVASVSLTSTSQYWFDITLPLPLQRFFRAWQPGTPSVMPSLDLHLVPALTLTGSIGGSVRVDAINQVGPTDAWVTLATVTLTSTSQLYFDTSAWGQPQRLYRVVPVP